LKRTRSGGSEERQCGARAGGDLSERVLALQDQVLVALQARRPSPWLSLDYTMSEVKTLFVLGTVGNATGRQLARAAGMGLSTMTGVVDRLLEHGLVTRGEDPDDRRVTRVALTPEGRAVIARLLQWNRDALARLLVRLDEDELRAVEAAFGHLLRAALAEAADNSDD
jgi:DNA-binding MarR family transcriptional regulator